MTALPQGLRHVKNAMKRLHSLALGMECSIWQGNLDELKDGMTIIPHSLSPFLLILKYSSHHSVNHDPLL